MLCFVVEDCVEGMRVQPGRRKDVGASLAFEEKRKPEGDVASLRRVQWFQRTLCTDQLVCPGLYCMSVNGGVLEGRVHQEARVPRVFGAV